MAQQQESMAQLQESMAQQQELKGQLSRERYDALMHQIKTNVEYELKLILIELLPMDQKLRFFINKYYLDKAKLMENFENFKIFYKAAVGSDVNMNSLESIGDLQELVAGLRELRKCANSSTHATMMFHDKEADFDIGRLHCFQDSWEDSSVSFLQSGGFIMSSKVPLMNQPTLVLWGANDEILEPSTANKFLDILPNAKLTVVEECGHVPHLEKPEVAALEILKFLGDSE
eukprot:gene5590-11273_t